MIGLLFLGTSSHSIFLVEKRFPMPFFKSLSNCCIKHILKHCSSPKLIIYCGSDLCVVSASNVSVEIKLNDRVGQDSIEKKNPIKFI